MQIKLLIINQINKVLEQYFLVLVRWCADIVTSHGIIILHECSGEARYCFNIM